MAGITLRWPTYPSRKVKNLDVWSSPSTHKRFISLLRAFGRLLRYSFRQECEAHGLIFHSERGRTTHVTAQCDKTARSEGTCENSTTSKVRSDKTAREKMACGETSQR